MFGYIRISKPELKVKEYEMYKAVYCSLCKTLGKEYGFFTRFTLSYDFTFLALLQLSLADEFCGTEKKRCACNPFKSCNYCKDSDLRLSAAAAMIMLYYKLSDDQADEKGFKKFCSKLLMMFFSKSHKKAARNFPFIETIVKEYIDSQRKTENTPNVSLDQAAEPTTNALAKVFACCCDTEPNKRVLYRLGQMLGRYIYLMDCACDCEDDAKKGAFNPLGKITKKEAAKRIVPQVYILIDEAKKAFELLPFKRFKDIIGNIIYVGIEDTVKKELE